ncbi:MAG: hypothetical protein WED33_03185 [Bacteroidia bacterium]
MGWVKQANLKKSFVISVFIIKILFGSGIVFIYTYYYTDRGSADIYKFFDDAQIIASAFPDDYPSFFKLMSGIHNSDPELVKYTSQMKNWEPQSSEWLEFTQTENYNIFQSNRIITRINAFLLLFSLGNIFTHVIFFSWLSLITSIAFLSIFRNLPSSTYLVITVLVLLLPSVLLWCSAPLKDTLTLAGINILFVSFYHIFISNQKKLFQNLVMVFLSAVVILFTKYYVLIAIIPALIYLNLTQIQNLRIRRISYFAIPVAFAALLLITPHINERFDVFQVLNNKREEALKAAIFGEANHLLFQDVVDGGQMGLILKAPNAIFTSLYRPLIIEKTDSIIVKLASIENLFLLILLLPFIYCLLKKQPHPSIKISLIIYVISLAFIIGFTTPVAGGVMRYKTALIPAYLIICLISLDMTKLFLSNKYLYKFQQRILNEPIHNAAKS